MLRIPSPSNITLLGMGRSETECPNLLQGTVVSEGLNPHPASPVGLFGRERLRQLKGSRCGIRLPLCLGWALLCRPSIVRFGLLVVRDLFFCTCVFDCRVALHPSHRHCSSERKDFVRGLAPLALRHRGSRVPSYLSFVEWNSAIPFLSALSRRSSFSFFFLSPVFW